MQDPDTGEVFLEIYLRLRHLDAAGNSLHLAGFVDRFPPPLHTDRATAVDASTGNIVAAQAEGVSAEDWRAELVALPQQVELQSDFFEIVRDNVPVIIKDELIKYIKLADATGRFD